MSSTPNPSGSAIPITKPLNERHYTTTPDLYNQWAATYDTDGNVLQKVDDSIFIERIVPLLVNERDAKPLRVLEIGCGTGRNTVKLQQFLPNGSTIYAIDVSKEMMSVAQTKIESLVASNASTCQTQTHFSLLDIQSQLSDITSFTEANPVDIIISTLVLEHVSLSPFFSAVSTLLRPGGWAWITSMHPDISDKTGAGFTRPDDNVRVQGVSYDYSIEDIVDAARESGLELEGDVVETGVGVEADRAVERFGEKARKWAGWRIFLGFRFKRA